MIKDVMNFGEFSNIDRLKNLYLEKDFTIGDIEDIYKEGYFKNIEWFDKNTLIVYRSVSILESNLDEFKKSMNKGIGRYWSFNKNIDAIWGGNAEYLAKDNEKIVYIRCKGYLKLIDIDFDDLSYAFKDDFHHFCDEQEIRGKLSGDVIKVVDYSEY
jgi:hypothetical protein